MSGLKFSVTKTITVAPNTTVTLAQIVAATNTRPKIKRLTVNVKAAAVGDKPTKFTYMRQTTAGTMSSLTPTKNDTDAAETLQTTAQHTATVEPTYGSEISNFIINGFGGGFVWIPPDQEGHVINGGDREGLVCITDAVASGNQDISFTFDCEE